MKNRLIALTLAACVSALSLSSFAEDAPKGWLVIRGGAANTSPNYAKEDTDINDNLERVSVLCADLSESAGNIANLIASDQTRTYPTYMVSTTTTAMKQGGTVVKDPLDRNPNHCLINGLPLSKIKGIWH